MKRRRIWAALGTAVLAAAPVAGHALTGAPAGLAQDGSELLSLAQHKGHGGEGVKAKAGGEGGPAGTAGGEGGESGEGGAGRTLPPNLKFYRDIELIRGHLLVGNELIEAGRWAEALPHFLHPEEEIYGGLREGLKTYGVAPFLTALKALTQTVKAKNKEAYGRARAALDERLTAAESAVRAKEANAAGFALETALEVLQSAGDEYGEAIEKGRIANVVEYQDARGFVLETERLVGTLADTLSAKDAEAVKALRAALEDLKTAFPAPTPPAKPVKDQGQFLADVSRFELQLGKLQ
jgi:hypothetical protein